MSFGRFFRRALRSVASIVNDVVPNEVKPIVKVGLNFVPGIGPALSAGYTAVDTYGGGSSLGNALKAGAYSYAGNKIGSSLGSSLGKSLGTYGEAAGNAGINLGQSVAGESLGATVGNAIGNYAPQLATNLAGTSIGGSIGGYLGSQAGNSFAGNDNNKQFAAGNQGPQPFKASQEAEQGTPASISGLGGLTQEQQSTSLANQGVYGQGNGPQEQSYYLNLLNRRLVDPQGRVNDQANLQPIEQSYLQRLGIGGGGGNTSDLLEAINRWRQTQTPQAA